MDHPSAAKAPGNFRLPEFRRRSIFREPKAEVLGRVLSSYGGHERQQAALRETVNQLIATLQSHCIAQEWSERQFANATDISRGTWRRMLKGDHHLEKSIKRLRAAAQRLNLTLS